MSNIKHGHSNPVWSPTYMSWHCMKARCSSGDKNYIARRITVCKRWMKFENFLADMGERPAGTSIDRYPDNDGDYTKSNCRWATPKEQANNRRPRQIISRRSMNAFEWRMRLHA